MISYSSISIAWQTEVSQLDLLYIIIQHIEEDIIGV